MNKEALKIENIPAVLWGENSDKIYICVHGKMSCKEEAQGFAEKATQRGYQIISFDLPQHGERIGENYPCNVWNCVHDLGVIGGYVQKRWSHIRLYANSFGAYCSLLAYKAFPLEKSLFLSPLLDMERLIENMMAWFNVSHEMLREKRHIPTPMGETLDWDYYCYVKDNPVEKWDAPTAILYGSEDNLTEREVIDSFVRRFHCDLTVLPGSGHYFHAEEQLCFWEKWLDKNI